VDGIPTVSASGQYVLYASRNNSIVSGDSNAIDDCFFVDLQTGRTDLVDLSSTGAQATGTPPPGGSDYTRNAVASADGRYMAFEAKAYNLVSRAHQPHPGIPAV